MFPKCSLDTRNIAMPKEHSANIPGILRAGSDGRQYISLAFNHSIKRYIRVLPFSWSLKYSWELRVHYIFYLIDGVFKFVPHSF